MGVMRGFAAFAGLACFLFATNGPLRALGMFEFAVTALCWAYSRHCQASFTARRTVSSLRVPRNDRLELVILASNRSRLPLYSCFFGDTPGMLSVGADDARWLLTLPPESTVALRYTIAGSSRGDFGIGPFRFRGGDPLGLFPFDTRIDDRAEVLVLPARIDVDLRFDRGVPQGEIAARDLRYEDVTLCRSIRDYRAGDELKRINWKATARLGRLYTNEYLNTLNGPLMVFCDLSAGRYPLRLRRDQAERVIETAAALVNLAAEKRQECGFASTGTGRPFLKSGSAKAPTVLDCLARMDMAAERDGDTEIDRAFLARAIASTPVGGRCLYVGPDRPDILAEGRVFEKAAEYVYEYKRR